jgi:PAS domain S-box-containing protein
VDDQAMTGGGQPQADWQREIHEREAQFRTLFEHSPDAIFLLDPHYPDEQWPIVDCNAVACRMNGYTREELIGQPIGLIDVGPTEPGGDIEFLAELRRQGRIQTETVHRRKDGTLLPIEFSICFITVGGRELVLGIDRDITERKRAEEERRALEVRLVEAQKREQIEAVMRQNEMLQEVDRLKSEFIANVSHELRTPLHHITGYTALLLQRYKQLDDVLVQDFLQTIATAGQQLDRLITDLLDTSRIEIGALKLGIAPVDVAELVRGIVQCWQGISSQTFHAQIPAHLPLVPADRGRIEQVLDNLLANVVKHTPPATEAVVSIELAPEELIVAVRDTGPGIAAEHLPRLFDRYYQANAPGGTRRGSGLGLFISKGIVEQHGGRMWVESAADRGTCFLFTLPRAAASKDGDNAGA